MNINYNNILKSFMRYLKTYHRNVKPWLGCCSHPNYKHTHVCLEIKGKIDQKQFDDILKETEHYYDIHKNPLVHVWRNKS